MLNYRWETSASERSLGYGFKRLPIWAPLQSGNGASKRDFYTWLPTWLSNQRMLLGPIWGNDAGLQRSSYRKPLEAILNEF